MFKNTLIIVGSILGLMALSVGGIYWAGFTGSIAEGQRNRIVKQSQAYTDGMEKELTRYWVEYNRSEAAGKSVIAAAVRNTFASVDTEGYPSHLQTFLHEVGAR